jgi:citrate lyase synthetase
MMFVLLRCLCFYVCDRTCVLLKCKEHARAAVNAVNAMCNAAAKCMHFLVDGAASVCCILHIFQVQTERS